MAATSPVAPRARPAERRSALAVAALTALAFCLFTYRLDAKGIWWDESLSLLRARLPVARTLTNEIDLPGITTVDLHPPAYFLLLGAVTRLAGESDVALRLPSAALGALLVPLLYAMGRRLRGPGAGLGAAALGAVSPYLLWYAQEARMYTMVAALCLGALYALWRALTEHSWAWGAVHLLLAVLAVGTQYLAALVIGAQWALVPLLWSGPLLPHSRRRRLLLGGLVLLALVGGGVLARQALLVRGQDAGRTYVPLGEMLLDALHALSLGLTVERAAAWPLAALFLAAYALGLVALWRRPPAGLAATGRARWAGPVALAGTLLGPILAMWLYSVLVGPLYMGSRYLAMCAPGFYLGVGVGLQSLWARRHALGAVALALLVGGMGLSDYRYFTVPAYQTKEDYRSAARLVAARERPGDVVLVTAPENLAAFTHYYTGAMPVVPLPSISLMNQPDAAFISADVQRVLEQHPGRLWLVHCRTMFSDAVDLLTRHLDEHTLLLERTVFPSTGSNVTVSAYLPYDPVQTEAPVAAELGHFGEDLSLRELTLAYAGADGALVPRSPWTEGMGAAALAGRAVSAEILFGVARALPPLKVSLRLLDAQGTVWAQTDREPYMYLPTTEWPAGSAVRYTQEVRIPPGTPPGAYRLVLVVYEAETGRALDYLRAGAAEAEAVLDLGALEVTRDAGTQGRAEAAPVGAVRPTFGAVFGDALELWAWEAAPERLQGGTLYVNLYWRARRAPGGDYALVVNWVDEGGQVRHTSTQPLTGVEYPTSRWQAGELVRGTLRLTLPQEAPRGRYSVHLLVASAADGRLLSIRRGPLLWAGRDLRIATVIAE